MSKEPDPRTVYADIIDLPHHQSAKRKHMSLHDRSAQFAPFAALVGYDEMVDEEARLTDRQVTPGESDLDRLDRIFRSLSARLSAGQRPEISVLVFVPDARKAGGCYETVTGRAKRLDPVEKKLILLGSGIPPEEISLNLDRILDLEGITEDGSD
jgi:hypothetical protein